MNSVSKLKCERIDSKSVLKALTVSLFTLCVRMCLPTLSRSFVNCFIEVGIVVRIEYYLQAVFGSFTVLVRGGLSSPNLSLKAGAS